MYNGAIVAIFEGIDGSGKTTTLNDTRNLLKVRGIPAMAASAWCESEISKTLRYTLLNGEYSMSDTCRFLLNCAVVANADASVKLEYNKKLYTPKAILLDQWHYSTMAYGDRGIEYSISVVEHMFNPSDLVPDVVFLIDCDPEVAIGRTERDNVVTSEKRLEDARMRYLSIATERSGIFRILPPKMDQGLRARYCANTIEYMLGIATEASKPE